MASNNRATQINKVLKATKKLYQPTEIPSDRTLLEHLLFACCAENSLHEVAHEVFTLLDTNYYDWNEVRVTSIRELTEVMKKLNDPQEAAKRLKRILQSVFETHYSFDLELMKKQNIGQTVKQIEKYKGSTPYIVAFVTQNALGGHSIPINRGLLRAMHAVGVVSTSEAQKGTVPGLERIVPKSKGAEVGTILHQLGVELYRSPYGPTIRKVLLDIEPTCKDNLPKRSVKKVEKPAKPTPAATTPAAAKPTTGKPAAEEKAKATKKPTAKEAAKEKEAAAAKKKPAAKPAKKEAAKPAAKKTATKKAAPTKKKEATTKKTATKKVAKKVVGKTTAKKTTTKKAVTKKAASKTPAKGTKKKSVTKKLSKKKPK